MGVTWIGSGDRVEYAVRLKKELEAARLRAVGAEPLHILAADLATIGLAVVPIPDDSGESIIEIYDGPRRLMRIFEEELTTCPSHLVRRIHNMLARRGYPIPHSGLDP